MIGCTELPCSKETKNCLRCWHSMIPLFKVVHSRSVQRWRSDILVAGTDYPTNPILSSKVTLVREGKQLNAEGPSSFRTSGLEFLYVTL